MAGIQLACISCEVLTYFGREKTVIAPKLGVYSYVLYEGESRPAELGSTTNVSSIPTLCPPMSASIFWQRLWEWLVSVEASTKIIENVNGGQRQSRLPPSSPLPSGAGKVGYEGVTPDVGLLESIRSVKPLPL